MFGQDLRLSRSEHEEYSMVDVTVKYPEIVAEWKGQGQKVRLNGQPEVIKALMKFVDFLYSEKRLMKGCAKRREIFA